MLLAPRKRWLEKTWHRAVEGLRDLEGIEVWEKSYQDQTPLERSHVDALLHQRRNRTIGLEEAWTPVILSLKPPDASPASLKGSVLRAINQSLTVFGLTHDTMLHHLSELGYLHATEGDTVHVEFMPGAKVSAMTLHFPLNSEDRKATHVSVNGLGSIMFIKEKENGQVESFLRKALRGFLRIYPLKTLRGKVPND